MKKMILMCMIVSLLLTAPSVLFAGGQNEAVVEQEEQITLQYWSWDPDMKGRNESLIAAFEAENPGISVEMTTLEPNEYWTKIRIMANQKKLPDVFNLSSGYVEEWSKSNLLMDLGPMISSSDSMDDFYFNLFDGVKDLSGTDTYYAFPYALVTTVLYYNMDMFDEAGLSYPDSSWDWDDFLQAAKALTRDLDGNGTIDQWGYWFYGRYAHIEPWVYANNGRLIDRQTMQFAPDAQGERALKFLTDLVLKHQVAPSKKEMSAFRQQDVFPNGAAAMFIDGSWNIDNNRIVAGDTIRWGIAEVPVGPSGDGSITYGWPDSLAIASNAKHPEAAWKFMSYAAGQGSRSIWSWPGRSRPTDL